MKFYVTGNISRENLLSHDEFNAPAYNKFKGFWIHFKLIIKFTEFGHHLPTQERHFSHQNRDV